MQTALTELGSQLTDAKTRLADQEAEIKNTASKLQLRLSEAEKLKTSFDAEKKSWADEKTLLTQRAETVEAALKEVTAELTGLKNRVSQMVSAIFGELFAFSYLHSIFARSISRLLNLLKHLQVLGATI